MRKLRTSTVAEVKALQANLEHVSTVLDEATRLRDAKTRGEEQFASLQARADEAARGIHAAEAEHASALHTLGHMQTLAGRSEAVNAQATMLGQSNAATEDRLRVRAIPCPCDHAQGQWRVDFDVPQQPNMCCSTLLLFTDDILCMVYSTKHTCAPLSRCHTVPIPC